MRTESLAIVGGGIIGHALAFEASSRGLDVSLFTRTLEGEGSRAAGGMLTPAMEADLTSSSLFDLAKLSRTLYPDWIQAIERQVEVETGYLQSGTLEVALHRDHLSDLEQLEAHQARLGFKTERLSSREILEREPQLTHRVQGALFAQDDHCVEPRRLLDALSRVLNKRGVAVKDSDVLSLDPVNGRINHTSLGRETTSDFDHVVVASGAWAQRHVPEYAGTLRPVKGQFIRVKAPHPLKTVIRTPDVYLIPRLNQEVYIGASQEEVGFQDGTSLGEIMDLLTDAWRTVPSLYDAEIIESGYGYRPALDHGNPCLGKIPNTRTSLAIGHYRHGVLLAPATAKVIVDQLFEPTPEFDMAPFAPRLGKDPL